MSFGTFYPEIMNRLKEGSIKNVGLYGENLDRSLRPYVTVKPIAGGDRKLLQMIVHCELGMHEKLEEYVLRELPRLLEEPLKANGKKTTARSTGVWYGPYVDEGDNTLAMSRDFYIPIIL